MVFLTDISMALGSVLTAGLTRFLVMGKIDLFLLSPLFPNYRTLLCPEKATFIYNRSSNMIYFIYTSHHCGVMLVYC